MIRSNDLGAQPSDLHLGFTFDYDPMDFTRKLEALDNYTMKESTMNCIKYLLFLLNLLISIVGSVIIVAGVVIQAAYRQHFDFLDHSVVSVSVFLILLGLLVTVISFCGCCGAIHEHHGLTSSYSWTLGSLFLIELGLGLVIYNLHNQVGGWLEGGMEAAMRNFSREGYRGVTDTWDVLQHELGCCGTQSYRDWVNTTFSLASHSVPDSCCLSDIVGCGRGILSIDAHQASMKIHSQGCMAVISHHMKENITMIVAIIVGTLFVQFLGLVFSFCLANSIKKECEIV